MSKWNVALVAGLVACTSPPPGKPADTGVSAPDGVAYGPEVVCADPVGDRLASLTEQRDDRGLDVELETDQNGNSLNFGGGALLEDLDRDGDLDIAFSNSIGHPRVMENDGTGHFTELPWEPVILPLMYGTAPSHYGAADVDGDGRLDFVLVGRGMMWVSLNEGGLQFGEPTPVWQGGMEALIGTMSMGDMDGDGDLDAILPGLETMGGGPNGPDGSPDILLRNDGDLVFTEVAVLTPLSSGQGGVNITAVFTDRDFDGDQDLMIPPDLGQVLTELPQGSFWRNDGGDGPYPFAEDDAAAVGFDLQMSAMGVTNADFNGDGQLDYCISDVGPAVCLVSSPDGRWFDAGAAMGIVPTTVDDPGGWSHWSIDLEDLDNDGWQDIVAAGGTPTGGAHSAFTHPDALFRGGPGAGDLPAFEDISASIDFADLADHYGGAVGDVDGDGFQDILLVGSPNDVRLWTAPCGSGSWTEVRLAGPPGNPTGVGARIVVEAGGRSWTREVMHIRALGQGPGWFHVGLGDLDRVDAVTVWWPDGTITELGDTPANRWVQIRHPDAL